MKSINKVSSLRLIPYFIVFLLTSSLFYGFFVLDLGIQSSDESSEDESDEYQGAVERCAEKLDAADPTSSSTSSDNKHSADASCTQQDPVVALSKMRSACTFLMYIFSTSPTPRNLNVHCFSREWLRLRRASPFNDRRGHRILARTARPSSDRRSRGEARPCAQTKGA